jgi:NADH-quinone oxidoreductase subunit A
MTPFKKPETRKQRTDLRPEAGSHYSQSVPLAVSQVRFLMPTSYPDTYFPVLVQIAIAVVVASALVTLSFVIGKRVKDRVKDSPYECGIAPTGSARERFSVKFYLVAIVFILFDIEAVFLYPWAVVYRELKMFAFVEMLLFVVLILSGFFYIWKKGALDWSGETPNVPLDTKPAVENQ